MSTAATAPTTTTSASPQTLKERVFEMYCNGLRSPAIAKQLHVPERTVRSWVRATMQTLITARNDNLLAYACLAEARQLQIAAAAWDGYRRVAAAEQLQLDELHYGTQAELATHPPRPTAAGARYLALAQRATCEVAKLQGAYRCPPPQPAAVEFRILKARPGPQHYQPPSGPHEPVLTGLELERYQYQEWVDGLQAQIESDQEQVAKGRARLAELNATLASQSAPSADDLDDDDADDPDDLYDPDFDEPDSPAETATAIPAPTPSAGNELAAETATAIRAAAADEVAAGLQPANPDPAIPSPSLAAASPAAPLSAHGADRAEGSDDGGAERAESGARGRG